MSQQNLDRTLLDSQTAADPLLHHVSLSSPTLSTRACVVFPQSPDPSCVSTRPDSGSQASAGLCGNLAGPAQLGLALLRCEADEVIVSWESVSVDRGLDLGVFRGVGSAGASEKGDHVMCRRGGEKSKLQTRQAS